MASPAQAADDTLIITSMEDVIANSVYNDKTRTYIVEATNIHVVGDVILPLDDITLSPSFKWSDTHRGGLIPRNIKFHAINDFISYSGVMISANGGGDCFRCGGPGGTIKIEAANVNINGSITANAAGAWAWYLHGGTIKIEATSIDVNGVIAATGGDAIWYGHGGTIKIEATNVSISDMITTNSGRGGYGGVIKIDASDVNISGSVAANAYRHYGAPGLGGGTIKIEATNSDISGMVTATNEWGSHYGGTIKIETTHINISGLISADGGLSSRKNIGTIKIATYYIEISGLITANGRPGGVIRISYHTIVPEDEPITQAHFSAEPDGTITFN